MFTGLVQSTGVIVAVVERPSGRGLSVAGMGLDLARTEIGQSVAVSGVCLTVVRRESAGLGGADLFTFDLGFETLERTTLGSRLEGDAVNLEVALRMGDPLGGHLVSGHVDGVGQVRAREVIGDALRLGFDAPAELRRFIAEKGSICVDGVSLTVNRVDAQGFEVGIVPHTLAVTTLGRLEPGMTVNLEVDRLARQIESQIESHIDAQLERWVELAVEKVLARRGVLPQEGVVNEQTTRRPEDS